MHNVLMCVDLITLGTLVLEMCVGVWVCTCMCACMGVFGIRCKDGIQIVVCADDRIAIIYYSCN